MKNLIRPIAYFLSLFLLVGVFLFTVPQTANAADRVPRMGDVVYDGKVTAEDARICLRAAVKLEKLNGAEFEACDVDADGVVTAGDAREILRYSVGIASPEISANRITAEDKILYLTFDDGPSRQTQRILDILDRYQAKATFFVLNEDHYAYQYKSIVDRGHSIGLHGYTHEYSVIYSSTDLFFDNLQKISDKVYAYTGVRSRLIRFPGGSSNTVSMYYKTGIMTELTKAVTERGYIYFDWNGSNDDETGESLTVREMVRRATAYNGIRQLVMLMHDSSDKYVTVEALPEIITFYQAQGYVCMALHENSFTAHHPVAN